MFCNSVDCDIKYSLLFISLYLKTTRGYPVALLVPVLASFSIESMKNEKETCCYRNINYCEFDGRGMCRQGKERNQISNRIGNRNQKTFFIFDKQKCLKTSNYLNVMISFCFFVFFCAIQA